MSKTMFGYTEEEQHEHQEKATKLFTVLMSIPVSEFIPAVDLNPRKFHHETELVKRTEEDKIDGLTLFNFDVKIDHKYITLPDSFADVPMPVLLVLYKKLKNNGYDLAMVNNQIVFGFK